MISYWELKDIYHDIQYSSSNPYFQRSSMTYDSYNVLYEKVMKRKEKIRQLYKSIGYNVVIGEITSYVDLLTRIMKNYSIMLRYNHELYEQQQMENNRNENNGRINKDAMMTDPVEQLLPFER
jgi:hypothetical protein